MTWLNKIIITLILCTHVCFGQTFISENNYKSKTGSGIVVVEVWADFNKDNSVDWINDLNDCVVYRIRLEDCSELNVKTVPTVIIYSSGEEHSRYKANIMLQLDATKKELQKVINEIVLSKFN